MRKKVKEGRNNEKIPKMRNTKLQNIKKRNNRFMQKVCGHFEDIIDYFIKIKKI